MSEKESSPEKVKPLYDTCNGCQKQYALTKENSVAFDYSKQPECNFLYCACPNCNFRTRIFLDKPTLQAVVALGIQVEKDEWASDHIYQDWLDLKGIELPKVHTLTQRQEKLIGQFALTMENCPDELLYQFITDENQNKPYPQRWT